MKLPSFICCTAPKTNGDSILQVYKSAHIKYAPAIAKRTPKPDLYTFITLKEKKLQTIFILRIQII